MSRDIVPRSAPERLIVAARIQDQFPDQFTVLRDDPHANALDER
jgi:hypothetical protein